MSILNLFRKPMSLWDEQRPLVLWNNAEPWTIGDSFEGVQVWGDTGSGKSSTTARVFAAAMLRAGYGGLVLTVKPEDADEWRRNLEENGRNRDGIFFGPQEHCFASVVWKYCTQLALQRRVNRERPVFIFSDESHYFVTDHDQLFQTTARSARCAVVYLTQNRSNYFAESPGDAGHNRIASMAACLKTQLLHQCSHGETRHAFSDAIGKRRIMRTKLAHSFGQGKPGHTETEEPVDEYWVLPDTATQLKTGGEANKYRVTAIVTKAGKRFRNGKPAMRVRFDQRKLERSFWASYTTVAIPKPKQDQ
jgi:hypothetical protein